MPNPTIGELLQQGLIITVLGITLVFAGLGLLWGVMEVLMRVLPPEKAEEDAKAAAEPALSDAAASEGAPAGAPDFTVERAQVAAIAAAMLLARALPGQGAMSPLAVPASADGTSGHNGHDDPWMSTNRVRSLQSWQPPRVPRR